VESFFPQNDTFVLKFFFDLLERGPVKYNKPLLHILEVLVPHVNFQSSSFQSRIPQWMATLERLVHGPLVELTLELLDRCMAHSQRLDKGSITLASVSVLGSESMMRLEFSNQQEEGTLLASSELAALVKQSGLAAVGGTEELASQAFFAKFFPESDDSGSSQHVDQSGLSDTMRMDEFNDEMLLGGFGTASGTGGEFFNMMSEMDSGAGGATAIGSSEEKHSQLHDQFNNYVQLGKVPLAAEMAFELGQVLFDGYVKMLQGLTFADDEIALLVSKYDKMLAGSKLSEHLHAFATGFKSSTASQQLQAMSKADRQTTEQNIKTALAAFNDQHTLYLTTKSAVEKKVQTFDFCEKKLIFLLQSHEKTKSSELRRLQAVIDLNLHFIRLLRKLCELRLSFEGLTGTKVKDSQQLISGLGTLEEKNRSLFSESQSLG
jgi:hypothetical protein